VRTTITIDENLLAQVRQRAAETGRTVSQAIEDAVRESLLRLPRPSQSRVELLTWHGGRPLLGVNLDDNASMQDLMDGTA
jgi:Arc/MetJ family transcription regulator